MTAERDALRALVDELMGLLEKQYAIYSGNHAIFKRSGGVWSIATKHRVYGDYEMEPEQLSFTDALAALRERKGI